MSEWFRLWAVMMMCKWRKIANIRYEISTRYLPDFHIITRRADELIGDLEGCLENFETFSVAWFRISLRRMHGRVANIFIISTLFIVFRWFWLQTFRNDNPPRCAKSRTNFGRLGRMSYGRGRKTCSKRSLEDCTTSARCEISSPCNFRANN